MADEGHAGTGQASFGHGVHGVPAGAVGGAARMAAGVGATGVALAVQAGRPFAEDAIASLFRLSLARNAEVMGGAGSLEFDIPLHLRVIHPVEHSLVLFRRNLLVVGDFHATTYRHQEEQVQSHGPQATGQRQCFRHLVDIVTGDRGVDLKGNAGLAQVVDAHQRLVKGARSPKDIVCLPIGAVKADADAADTGFLNLRRYPAIDKRAVCRQGDDQAGMAGVGGDVENVGPEEWFAARQHENRAGEGGNVVDHELCFTRGQILWRKLIGDRDAPAVYAGEVTAGRCFPEDESRW